MGLACLRTTIDQSRGNQPTREPLEYPHGEFPRLQTEKWMFESLACGRQPPLIQYRGLFS